MTLKGLGTNASIYKTPDDSQSSNDTDSTCTEVETVQSSLCCLQGCLAASAVGFAFFVGLPSGILLVFYASKNQEPTLLAVGGVLVALPVLTLIIFSIICLFKSRLKRLNKRNNNSVQKDTGEDNSRY
ncbi:uncharacterized protein [Haliotis cracherodii]|uniref:uncharacterized protein n=1 Tax=Haliotis cracherodii TaxID=6455 RepID=UPI0039EC15E4